MSNQKNKTGVIFVSKGLHAASTRYRALHYFECLAGFRPEHFSARSNPVNRITLLFRARRARAVVIIRRLLPAWYMKLLRSACNNIIFDFDDAIFVRSNGNASENRMRRFNVMLQYCTQVWAGNGFLARAAGTNNNVILLPTAIDENKYNIQVNKPENSIDLVWIGSSSTRRYLEMILPALESAARDMPGLRLKIIADFDLQTETITTVPVQWADNTEADELASSHIGIAPLIDNDWTRGKCGLKLLQYMAAGLPVITSPCGANSEIVVADETGLFADTDRQWVEAINRLAADTGLRETMGKAGKKRVSERYSISANCKTITRALSQ